MHCLDYIARISLQRTLAKHNIFHCFEKTEAELMIWTQWDTLHFSMILVEVGCKLKYEEPLHLQEFRNVQATHIEEPGTMGIYFAKEEASSLQDIIKRKGTSQRRAHQIPLEKLSVLIDI